MPKKHSGATDTQKHVTGLPTSVGALFTDRKQPAISEVGTFERIALHSTFVRGGIRAFRMFPVKQVVWLLMVL